MFYTLKELVEYLENKYKEKIEALPIIPYEKNISFYGKGFKASIYRLSVTGVYELVDYKL